MRIIPVSVLSLTQHMHCFSVFNASLISCGSRPMTEKSRTLSSPKIHNVWIMRHLTPNVAHLDGNRETSGTPSDYRQCDCPWKTWQKTDTSLCLSTHDSIMGFYHKNVKGLRSDSTSAPLSQIVQEGIILPRLSQKITRQTYRSAQPYILCLVID